MFKLCRKVNGLCGPALPVLVFMLQGLLAGVGIVTPFWA